MCGHYMSCAGEMQWTPPPRVSGSAYTASTMGEGGGGGGEEGMAERDRETETETERERERWVSEGNVHSTCAIIIPGITRHHHNQFAFHLFTNA